MMKKSAVTLVNEIGERHTFESSRSACDFLGLKSQSVITAMKKASYKKVAANGHDWHCEDGKAERPMAKTSVRISRSKGIIAFKNLGSTNPKHPEKTKNFPSIEAAAEYFGRSERWVRGRFRGCSCAVDEWHFRTVEDKGVRDLLHKIAEDDGIINLDEADELW